MERVVVASALSALKDLLGENERGILVNLFDRETSDYNARLSSPENKLKDLADAIICLAQRSDIRQEIGHRGRGFVVEDYDWNIISRRIEALYKSVNAP